MTTLYTPVTKRYILVKPSKLFWTPISTRDLQNVCISNMETNSAKFFWKKSSGCVFLSIIGHFSANFFTSVNLTGSDDTNLKCIWCPVAESISGRTHEQNKNIRAWKPVHNEREKYRVFQKGLNKSKSLLLENYLIFLHETFCKIKKNNGRFWQYVFDMPAVLSMDMLESNLKVIDNITDKETFSGVTHKPWQVLYQIEGLY